MGMDIECNTCNTKIDNNNYFECDGCTSNYHLKCDGVNKKDIDAKKNSDRLMLFCQKCIKNPEKIIDKNIKTVLKFVHKIDLYTQVSEKTNTQVCYDIERIKDKIDLISKNFSKAKCESSNDARSYADIVKNDVNLPVIVKPVEKTQKSTVTRDEIKNKISFKEIKANGLKKVRDGGILINCQSQAETMKLKQLVMEKIGDKYEVEIPTSRKPRLKIIDVFDEMTNEEVIENIKTQNELLEHADIEVKAILNKSKRNNKRNGFDVIIEAKQEDCNIMLQMQSINIGWKRCKVVEHTYIKRCYNCCGFSHIAKDCRNKRSCRKCAGDHEGECNSVTIKCINCSILNDRLNLKLNTQHEAYDRSCEVYKRKIKFFQNNNKFLNNSD